MGVKGQQGVAHFVGEGAARRYVCTAEQGGEQVVIKESYWGPRDALAIEDNRCGVGQGVSG